MKLLLCLLMNISAESGARLIQVAAEYDGQRIDNFLLRTLKGVPKSRVYRILRKGEVRVNRGRIRPDYRLHAGDLVRIPPVRLSVADNERHPPPPLLERVREAILLEDREVLVLNKPAGITVHKGSGVDFGIIEALRALRPEAPFLELAHRLDRETSGCLVLAKTPAALQAVHTALRIYTAAKHYLALVRGHWNQGTWEVTAPLRKNVLRGGERLVQVVEGGGRPARTCFKPISLFRQAALLKVEIATGRTHQIRVHAAHIGYPIAGDDKYGDPAFNREMARYGLRRLFLHAHSLTVPLGGREIAVSAPLDETLREVLERLETES